MNLTDRSSDRRFLTFAISDLSRGRLDTLPLEGSGERRPVEIFHSDMRIFDPKFSPDSRFLSYLMIDKANKMEVFVRPLIRRRLVDRGRFLQAAPARNLAPRRQGTLLCGTRPGRNGGRRAHVADAFVHDTQSAVSSGRQASGPRELCERRRRTIPGASAGPRAAASAAHHFRSARSASAESG